MRGARTFRWIYLRFSAGLFVAILGTLALSGAIGPSRLAWKMLTAFVVLPAAIVWVLDVVTPVLLRLLLVLLRLADRAETGFLAWVGHRDPLPDLDATEAFLEPVPTLREPVTLIEWIVEWKRTALLILYLAFVVSLGIAAVQMLAALVDSLDHGYFAIEFAKASTAAWRNQVLLLSLWHIAILIAIPFAVIGITFFYSLASPFREYDRIVRHNSVPVALVIGAIILATTMFIMPAARSLVAALGD